MAASTLPGPSGLSLIGEMPLFLRDLHSFVATRIRHYGPVFRTYLLSLPTVISCSYYSTRQLLTSDTKHATIQAAPAYSEFLRQIYPKPNLLTGEDDSHARRVAATFTPALQAPWLAVYQGAADRLAEQHAAQLRARIQRSRDGVVYIQLYEFFKGLCEKIVTTVLLGTLDGELYSRVRRLCSAHFNGVVAVPISVSMFGVHSARAKGIQAYEELERLLQELVAERVKHAEGRRECVMDVVLEGILERGEDVDAEMRGHVVQFLLVLLSTAIPKCLASALTSAVREGGRDAEVGKWLEGDGMEMVLMEVLRLWPPLIGGMRMTEGGDTQIGGHAVSGVWRVWYSIWHSNRDGSVYERGGEFWAGRWKEMGSGCPFGRKGGEGRVAIPLTFGEGERMCPGREVAWMVLCKVLGEFCGSLEVVGGGERAKMRFFPVVREAKDTEVGIRVKRVSK